MKISEIFSLWRPESSWAGWADRDDDKHHHHHKHHPHKHHPHKK